MASTSGDCASPPSENDAGERPVRKQLKETSIDSATTSSESRRKRSIDETRADAAEDTVDVDTETGESRRKRSRESSPQDAEKTKIQSVSSPPSTQPISDPAKEEALESVNFPDFTWIAQLDARERALARRSRELEAAALALEAWKLELQKAEAKLKQREKWFRGSVDKLEECEEEISAREAAVEARERALDLSESGWDSEENTDVDDITPQDTTAADTTTDTTTEISAMPKKKRSLEQLDEIASKKSDAVTEDAEHPAEIKPSEGSLGEPEKKRPRDSSQERSTKAEKVSSDFPFSYLSLADQIFCRVSQQVHSPIPLPLPLLHHLPLTNHPTTPPPPTRPLQLRRSHHPLSLPSQVRTNLPSAHSVHLLHLFSSHPITPCLASRPPLAVLVLVDSAVGSLVLAVDSQLRENLVD